MKRTLTLVLVAVITMTALLSIPASAAPISHMNFSRPNCGCSADFSGQYGGGVYGNSTQIASATADVTHECESAFAYVSVKCWVAPWSNLNNYRSMTFTASDSNPNEAIANVTKNLDDYSVALLGVENYYKISVTHNGVEYASQARSNDGNIPLAYTPPVVTE
ncbi:MAG: hypothetical protein E7460_00700 [Ruminococcaceae bacterium]|nr:hypothetical protein [Oscillospiraceae bacterium]